MSNRTLTNYRVASRSHGIGSLGIDAAVARFRRRPARFSTGIARRRCSIYVAGAMFNHDCRPNLISQPRPNGAPGTCMMATRAVAAGQELTFSYLSPLEQSSTQRSKKFEFQHLCQLGSSPWPQVRRLCAALCARLAARDCWRWRCAGESGGAPNPSRARLLPARISRRWRPFLQNWSA